MTFAPISIATGLLSYLHPIRIPQVVTIRSIITTSPDSIDPVDDGDHDHDSTCIYLADGSHAILPTTSIVEQSSVYGQLAFIDAVVPNRFDETPFRPQWPHAPPESLVGGYDLILKLRTLRI
jgi:hypothetical protein